MITGTGTGAGAGNRQRRWQPAPSASACQPAARRPPAPGGLLHVAGQEAEVLRRLRLADARTQRLPGGGPCPQGQQWAQSDSRPDW